MRIPRQDSTDSQPLFFPPLWKQRRSFVSETLLKHGISSVLDLGCGEGALLEILINEATFQRLGGVELDRDVLQEAADRCSPKDLDYRFLRELPVQVDLYSGSLDVKDPRCLLYDAITCIEVYVTFGKMCFLNSIIIVKY